MSLGKKSDRAFAVRIASSKDMAVATCRWLTLTSQPLADKHQRIFPPSNRAENHRHTEASSALAHAAARARAARSSCTSIVRVSPFIVGTLAPRLSEDLVDDELIAERALERECD